MAKFKLMLVNEDSEVVAQWTQDDAGDLSKPMPRENLIIEICEEIKKMEH